MKLALYKFMFGLAFGLVVIRILVGCSGDYTREKGGIAGVNKNGIVTDLHKYCLEVNPKDSACQKDK